MTTLLEPQVEVKVEPPLALLAELTHRCPLRCPYCSNPQALAGRSDELPTEAWLDVLAQAGRLGMLQVHLSGGEPAARRDLEALVQGARAAGLYTNLITSGFLLDRDRLERLKQAGLDHVQLSVQDSEATGADRIAGLDGAHARKLAIAPVIRAAGLPLTLNVVIHRHNIARVPDLIALAVSLDAARIEVAHAQYYGWGLDNRGALMPTRAQLETATAQVSEARERLKGRLVIDYVLPDYYARRPKACMGGWARRFMVVAPDGQILPCHAAPTIPDLPFPNVRETRLNEAWFRDPAFARFRGTDWMREPCRSCDRREIDWGGCRCQALALAGAADAVDPACALSPLHEQLVALAERESATDAPAFRYRGNSV
ncbi:pyrroloquinoline quinone biosynthesis protein PqqE [Reyranella sp. CPCC 100927]|uniref:pyrroloquinoline quinone biosynthesis protein PqqE n=1 Tax=Reyranella sp. CPCC 100927 TaxID=2599616 RepID=UPI0011B82FD3|nr:pyrroloquinoline quinone biosynthesis protein PqqE [Reyranella sp. CPCC 100927]TWT13741.1 pyrroloquinoline quinone biosynthesis protein PqqE [Reyranella sp. CPCC 100927]